MKRITKKIYLVIAVIVGAITTVGAWTLWKVIDPARAPRLYGPPQEEEIRCIYGPPSMFEQNSEENDSGAQKVDSIREKQENQQRKKE